jgi:hypothetical protein
MAGAGDVDISVAIRGEIVPGVYGRVDLTNRPAPPPVVYAQPVVIERPPPEAVVQQPIYLHVPPGHAHNWRKHCHEYHACNRPVYFVKSAEYEPGYVRDRDNHRDDRDERRGDDHHDHGDDHHDHGDDHHDHGDDHHDHGHHHDDD